MTNQQKLQTLRNLTGPSLYSVIIKELGPGTIHIPLDDGIPESRNLKIRAEFNSPEFEEKPLEVIYRTLAERHNLSTRQITKRCGFTTVPKWIRNRKTRVFVKGGDTE